MTYYRPGRFCSEEQATDEEQECLCISLVHKIIRASFFYNKIYLYAEQRVEELSEWVN
jgi:hypothetical protein